MIPIQSYTRATTPRLDYDLLKNTFLTILGNQPFSIITSRSLGPHSSTTSWAARPAFRRPGLWKKSAEKRANLKAVLICGGEPTMVY